VSDDEDPLDPEQTTIELRAASRALAASAAKLGKLMKEYAGTPDEPGAGKRFDQAVAVRKVMLFRNAISAGERPPGEEARQAIADVEIREAEPALAADRDRMADEMAALKQFISSQKQVISGHQSVLSAAKVLSGLGH
jgi:hypothetical protein